MNIITVIIKIQKNTPAVVKLKYVCIPNSGKYLIITPTEKDNGRILKATAVIKYSPITSFLLLINEVDFLKLV